jgi:hypothetical protein
MTFKSLSTSVGGLVELEVEAAQTCSASSAQVGPSVGRFGSCLFTGYSDWMEAEKSLGSCKDLAA